MDTLIMISNKEQHDFKILTVQQHDYMILKKNENVSRRQYKMAYNK